MQRPCAELGADGCVAAGRNGEADVTLDSLILALRDGSVMLPLGCSVVAGALIGGEREFQGKPAGLRTHTLVCFASALMTLVGLRLAEWSQVLPPDAQIVSDFARMPHAILTGIGFLGAGVIFREGASVQGLTTAASLWLTAALGIVFGTGLLELGVVGTGVALVVLVALRILQGVWPARPAAVLDVTLTAESGRDGGWLRDLLAARGLRTGPVSVSEDRAGGSRRYRTLVSARSEAIDCDVIARALRDEPDLRGWSIAPLGG